MSFRDLSTQRSNAGRDPATGTVNACVTKQGRVYLSVAEDVLGAMGNPSAFRIMIGDGEHAGHVALLPSEIGKGAFKVHKPRASRQGRVQVTATRIGVAPSRRATINVPILLSATGVIVDLRPLRAPSLSVAA